MLEGLDEDGCVEEAERISQLQLPSTHPWCDWVWEHQNPQKFLNWRFQWLQSPAGSRPLTRSDPHRSEIAMTPKFGAPRGHPNSVSPSSSAAANLGRADRDSSLSSAYAARGARLLSASLMRAPIPPPHRQALGAHQATGLSLFIRRCQPRHSRKRQRHKSPHQSVSCDFDGFETVATAAPPSLLNSTQISTNISNLDATATKA
ncbi:hypothetical protein ACFX13_037793 [Malus domestica]